MLIDYKEKYLKYKQKYIELKNVDRTKVLSLQIGGKLETLVTPQYFYYILLQLGIEPDLIVKYFNGYKKDNIHFDHTSSWYDLLTRIFRIDLTIEQELLLEKTIIVIQGKTKELEIIGLYTTFKEQHTDKSLPAVSKPEADVLTSEQLAAAKVAAEQVIFIKTFDNQGGEKEFTISTENTLENIYRHMFVMFGGKGLKKTNKIIIRITNPDTKQVIDIPNIKLNAINFFTHRDMIAGTVLKAPLIYTLVLQDTDTIRFKIINSEEYSLSYKDIKTFRNANDRLPRSDRIGDFRFLWGSNILDLGMPLQIFIDTYREFDLDTDVITTLLPEQPEHVKIKELIRSNIANESDKAVLYKQKLGISTSLEKMMDAVLHIPLPDEIKEQIIFRNMFADKVGLLDKTYITQGISLENLGDMALVLNLKDDISMSYLVRPQKITIMEGDTDLTPQVVLSKLTVDNLLKQRPPKIPRGIKGSEERPITDPYTQISNAIEVEVKVNRFLDDIVRLDDELLVAELFEDETPFISEFLNDILPDYVHETDRISMFKTEVLRLIGQKVVFADLSISETIIKLFIIGEENPAYIITLSQGDLITFLNARLIVAGHNELDMTQESNRESVEEFKTQLRTIENISFDTAFNILKESMV